MKKLLFIFLVFTNWCFAQVQTLSVQANPAVFTENDQITITFSGVDPTIWNAGQPDNIYLWAWYYDLNGSVGGDSPTNGTWTSSNEAQKLTKNGDGTYSFTLTPSAFYGVTGISKLGLLVKAKDGSDTGAGEKKSNDQTLDVQINQLTLTSPTQDPTIVNPGTQITISATTIFSSDFSLKANGTEINTATAATSYSYNVTINQDTNFVLEANDGNQLLSKAFSVRIPSAFPVPNGMLDGINLDPNDNTKATLVLYAPGKQTVHVIGDFNNWQEDSNYLMHHDTARDRFWIELTGLTPQHNHMYQYLVDSSIRIADPYSTVILDPVEDQYIDGTTYPNLPAYPTGLTTYDVTLLRTGDPAYNWQTTNYTKPEKTDLVIYELLIRDFDALHSFDAVKARLDYIQSLGVNAIELMPVSEFDGNLSWGYNPAFHMALDKYYGTANAFKQLIDECHSRGMAVIMDVVYNHASGQNPYYRLWNTDNGGYNGQAAADNPFFNQTATHTYSVYNDFNHSKQATRDYVKRTTQYWISEFKIDGFRWDLTKGFTQNCSDSDYGCTDSYQQDRVDVLKQYADYQWDIDPNFYVIFEHLGGITEEKQWADYRANEGKGIMLWNKQDQPYGEATIGNHTNGASNFSNVSYANKGFDGPSAVSYMESHDEQRIMYRNLQDGKSSGDYSVKNLDTALDRMRTAGAFFFTVPGPKMIWQFGELGYEVDINFNGRTGNKPIRWEYLDDPNRMAIYTTWSKLIQLKHNVPIFKTTDFTLDVGNSNGLKSIHLSLASAVGNEIKYVTIFGNFGLTNQSIDPAFQETGTWYDLLNKNNPIDVSSASSPITLAPGEFKVYGNNPYINPDDLDSDGVANANDICPNTPLGTVVDVNGCEVFTLPATNFSLQVVGETCRSSNNGSINISAVQNLNYTATIVGNGINQTNTFTTNYSADNLEAGEYDVCITVDGQSNYEQCFHVFITQPEDISVLSKVSNTKSSVSLDMSGSSTYKVTLNGVTTKTTNSNIELKLNNGINTISVEGEKICQGVYTETIFYGEDMMVFPNPVTNNVLNVFLGNSNFETVNLSLYSILGKEVFSKKTNETNLKIDTSRFSKGIYILNVSTNKTVRSFKIIKN